MGSEMCIRDRTITAYPDEAGNTVYHFDRLPETADYTGS